jgi:pyruvate ferredoxin oxidoreductase beta subunit
VETNYFPLWECERGRFRFTRDVSNPKPVGKYTRLIGKFSHLRETEIQELQEMVNQRIDMIKSLVNIREVRR